MRPKRTLFQSQTSQHIIIRVVRNPAVESGSPSRETKREAIKEHALAAAKAIRNGTEADMVGCLFCFG